jgi:uncharacterized protein (DUF427 family)
MANPAPGFTQYPNHRVAISPDTRRVRVLVDGQVIGDSQAAFLVDESRHEPMWYLPPGDVDEAALTSTTTTSYCPFKGHASYWRIDAGAVSLPDAVWSYLEPFDECRDLAGYYAFYPDKVVIEVDGSAQRPT